MKKPIYSLMTILCLFFTVQMIAQPTPPNGKKWEKIENMSDEFNGSSLNTTKWADQDPQWEGRPPARFEKSAVKVGGGNLQITASRKSNPSGRWTHNGGLVRSKVKNTYGYYEVKMKANKTFMSSTFWLINKRNEFQGCDFRTTELDVTENIGVNSGGQSWINGLIGSINSNTHSRGARCSSTPQGIRGGRTDIGEPSYAGYHTYGVWWKGPKELLFYIDGRFAHKITPVANFNLAMYLRMVVETYDWNPPKAGRDGMNDSFANRTTYYDWIRSYRLVDCNSNCGNDPDPNPNTVAINCNSMPSTLTNGTTIQVPVSYTADQDRDVVVELWNSGWLGEGRKRVTAGSGTATLTISLNNAPPAGSNYQLKASIRPVGAGWQQNIKACTKSNITLSGTTVDPDPDSSKTVTLSAIDDAYLQGNTRFNSTILRTENGRRVSYLKFNVSEIKGAITNASLKLTVNGDSGNGNINVNVGNSNNWTENNLSTSNAPGIGRLLGNLNKTFELNQVQNFGLNNLSVNGNFLTLIVTQTGGNDVSFASDENSTGKPVLTMTYTTSTDPDPDPNCLPKSLPTKRISNQTFNYTSDPIDISCVSKAKISLKATGVGSMENEDYLRIYYTVDGGARKTILENVNTYAANTLIANNISGNNLRLIIEGKTSVSSEVYTVENITISASEDDGNTGGSLCNTTNTVSGLKSTGNTNTTVTVAFNELSGVNVYELRAFAQGSFNGNINGGAVSYKSSSNSPIAIEGLKPGTGYTFVLRALCSAGGTTPISQVNASTSGSGSDGGDSNVGAPDNGDDSGCTGKDTFDQGVKIVPNANSWKDSYKANGYCFCNSSFDHGVGNFKLNINGRNRNIRDICDELKKHPKFRAMKNGDPRYNTIQCGNEPGHGDAITIQGKRIKDEKVCPGRVDQGSKGCKCKGPKFDMKWLSSRSRFDGGKRSSLVVTTSNDFSIYPNPITADGESFLSVYAERSELARVSVHDLNGRVIASVYHKEVEGTMSSINITDLIQKVSNKPGMYLVSYNTRSGSLSKTIIVK